MVTFLTVLLDSLKKKKENKRLLGKHTTKVLAGLLFLTGVSVGWLTNDYFLSRQNRELISSLIFSSAHIADLNDELDKLKLGPKWVPSLRATLYTHVDFQGEKLYLHPGKYPDLQLSYFDDKVTSVKLEGGVYAIAYDEPGIRGNSLRIDSDLPSLVPLGWNDRIRSIEVLTK